MISVTFLKTTLDFWSNFNMKISLNWLNEFVDISDYLKKTQDLADLLTKAGLEVEEITDLAKDFNHVVVGYIQLKDKHPNADKLSLCQVEVAPGKIEQIVCGAQNHKTGDKVIVALPGAVLPGNFAIKKSKIRDVESAGMLCSYKELGLATESDGIVILPKDAVIGQSFADFGGYNDVTFELKVTPNRADCLSHYGLAREIGCLLNRNVKNPEVAQKFSNLSTKSKIKLQVENSDLCPRYCGRFISGVKIQDSPKWLKQKIESIGLNSINNVVDVTNYVMHEMGQPLHAFDADLISGQKIIVRQSQKNEKFKTLKEQDLVLSGEELVIADAEKVVALAGVIGGINSGVSEKTTNIFLESANFKSMSVRKTSRSHGIETDSAYRFSRGVDQSQTSEIMDRAVLLIQHVAGGEASADPYDIYPTPVVKSAIKIHLQTLSDRLGYPAEANLFEQYMTGLQCRFEKNGSEYAVTPPLFRFDLERDMDLVEEYARLKGYEHITETLPTFSAVPTKHDTTYTNSYFLASQLRSFGLSQAFNYAFTSSKNESQFLGDIEALNQCGLNISKESISIKNPLSEDINVMRKSLMYPIWKNVLENFHAGNAKGKIFEIGSVFSKVDSEYKESRRLVIAMWGEAFGVHASTQPLVVQLRNLVEELAQVYKISMISFPQDVKISFLHLGQSSSIFVEGKKVGVMGTVHPKLLGDEKIRVPVVMAEINLDLLIPQQARPLKFKAISSLQPVDRDFAFVMEAKQKIGDLTKEIKKCAGAFFKDVTVFDIYQGDKLPAGQKSVALRLSLQPQTVALTDAEIQNVVDKVVQSAEKSVGAKLRG